MASGALLSLSYKMEKIESGGTYGTDPGAGSQAVKEWRYSSYGLKPRAAFTETDEVRSDRQVVENIRTDWGVLGQISAPWGYLIQDDFVKAMLMVSSSFSTSVNNTKTTYSSAASDNSINDSGSGFVSDGYLAGGFLRIPAALNAAGVEGVGKIVSVAAGKIVLSGITVTTQAAGASYQLKQSQDITNASTIHSLMTEARNTDLTNEFEVAIGLMVSGGTLDIPTNGLMKWSFDLMGKNISSAAATTGTGTITAASTNKQFSTVDHLEKVAIGGSVSAIIGGQIRIENNLREHKLAGLLGPNDFGLGMFRVRGNFNQYYAAKAQWDAFKALTSTSIWLSFKDAAGNRHILELPELIITHTERTSQGKDSDIIQPFEFSAQYGKGAADLKTMRYCRLAA